MKLVEKWLVCMALIFALAVHARAGTISAILDTNDVDISSALFATGGFTAVDRYDVNAGLPSLATLLTYDSVLAYTDFIPNDPVGFGDLLADYVDAGGHVVLANFGYSDPIAIAGRIATPGYAPLVNVGTNADVSG